MLVEMGTRLNPLTPIILAIVFSQLTIQLAAVAESSTSGANKWNYDGDNNTATTASIGWTTPTLTTIPTSNFVQTTASNSNSIKSSDATIITRNDASTESGSLFSGKNKIVDIFSDSRKVLQQTLIELVKQKTTAEEYTITTSVPSETYTLLSPNPQRTTVTTNDTIESVGTSPRTYPSPWSFQNSSESPTSTNLSASSIRYFMTPTTRTATSGPVATSTVNIGNTTAFWPVKHASVVEGDVILGGLMMVHSREDSITCGPIMPQGGIQALEAMLYTLDQVNKNQLLPNVTLGAHILDDCDKDTYGLEMAVDFIKGLGMGAPTFSERSLPVSWYRDSTA